MSKHHFIPQFLLRNFRGEDGKLWYYDIERSSKGVEARNPSKVFYHRNLNKSSDGEADVETQFNERLETPFSELVSRIISEIREGKTPVLSSDDQILCSAFLYYQWKRYPEILERALEFNTGKDPERDREEVEQVRKILESASEDDQAFVHDLRLSVMARANPSVMKHIANKGFWFAVAPPDSHFVVGSNLIHRHKFQVSHPIVSDVTTIVMPLASDIALCVGPEILSGQVVKIRRKADVRKINKLVCSHSRKVAGPDKTSVEKLVARKASKKE